VKNTLEKRFGVMDIIDLKVGDLKSPTNKIF
jgi:hypothetical protein